MKRQVHPLYQRILEQLIEIDRREFQLPLQQRLVQAMNYLQGRAEPDEDEIFKI
jgi:hypothetical protein